MSTLWGEMPTECDRDNNGVNIDQAIERPHSLEVEGPTIHQPSLRHFPPVNE